MPDESTHADQQPDPHLTATHTRADTSITPDGTVVQATPPTVTRAPRTALIPQVPGFDILEELGRGGMGVVYKARQQGLGRVVALKMVLHGAHATADELDRFRAEAEAIARLRHLNIVEVYAYGETDTGLPYFALEFCDGGTLVSRCAQSLPLRDAVEIVVALAHAVQAAHTANIVHRDLKPANVLLTADGVPKVTDFGLAKGLGEAHGRTQTGAVMGTPAYMAPEQAAGRTAEIGPLVDVYALGAILYHLLTGRPPFDGANVVETLQRVQRDEPMRPRRLRKDVPPDLEAVVLRCLEKVPAERYASAADLAADLQRWLNGDPVLAHRHSVLYRVRKRLVRRRRWIAAGAALMLLAAATWLMLADGGLGVPGGEWTRRQLDRHELSLQRPSPSVAKLRVAAATQRTELSRHALYAVTRKGNWLSGSTTAGAPFDRPDAWSQVQATACLLAVPEVRDDEIRPLIPVLHTELFGSNPCCRPFDPVHGWSHFFDNQPATEALGWALAAIPRALSRPGLCTPAERELLLHRLDQVQACFEQCYIRDGSAAGQWTFVTRPLGDREGNIYTTTMAYQGLMELWRAKLPWRGSEARRDELLHATQSAILAQFHGRGWVAPGLTYTAHNEGLSLQSLNLLLRAERLGLVVLPEPVVAHVPGYLADLAARPFDHPVQIAVFNVHGLGYRDEEITGHRAVRMLWHPWGIGCAARWHARLIRTGAPHEQLVANRRILAHLTTGLWEQARGELEAGGLYVLMETLLGLTALEEMD